MEAQILLLTAASIAMLHTILGPDHYLPFVAMAKARQWSFSKTLRITFYCGLGHVMSSVLIGGIGIALGSKLESLVAIESSRGSLAGWALLAFGCVYFAWGLRAAGRSHKHTHMHAHGDLVHAHPHTHNAEHAHTHEAKSGSSITPWALFIVFVLGPCEALIPLFMYPAAMQSGELVLGVALVFGLFTLATMLVAVSVATYGLRRIRLPRLGQYAHAAAGASIALCGVAINFIGL